MHVWFIFKRMFEDVGVEKKANKSLAITSSCKLKQFLGIKMLNYLNTNNLDPAV